MALKGWLKGPKVDNLIFNFCLPLPAIMRIWALLFQVKSLTFDSVVVAAAGKAFESSVAAVQPSSSLQPGTVAGSVSADLSAFDAELLYFLALSSSIPILFFLPEFLLILKFFF